MVRSDRVYTVPIRPDVLLSAARVRLIWKPCARPDLGKSLYRWKLVFGQGRVAVYALRTTTDSLWEMKIGETLCNPSYLGGRTIWRIHGKPMSRLTFKVTVECQEEGG